MDIYRAFKLIIRYFWLLVLVPIIFGGLMYLATQNQPREYSSKATIFTGLTSGYSIESQASDRVDYFATTAAFDNMLNILKSKNVLEEVGIRLFIQNIMLEEPDSRYITPATFADLQSITPQEVKDLVVKDNPELTYERMLNYKNQSEDNFLYELLNLKHRHYSFEALSSRVNARRVQGSDLLEISYKSDDPGITYQTLNILIEVFFQVHSSLKMAQTSTVVDYFEKQLANAWERLVAEENKLLEFNKENRIINYHEQTKYVASQKEQFELAVQQTQLESGSAASVLLRLEKEINSRFDVNLRTQKIGNLRNELLNINQQIEQIEILKTDDSPAGKMSGLLDRKATIENQIRLTVDSLFMLERNIDGVEREYILQQWFENTILLEGAKARLKVLESKRREFDELYMFFAPLGATINRMERAIDVFEKEYLSILHNLGLAKLKQQNLELSATMDILDKPYYPITTQPSKRKLFVLIIAIFSFLFVLAGIFITEFLDRRLKTVKRLENLTGLKAAGVIVKDQASSKVDIPKLSERAMTDLTEHLFTTIFEKNQKSPIFLQVFSHWENEGKSYFVQKLSDELQRLGYRVSILNIGENENVDSENTRVISEAEFYQLKSPEDLCGNHHSSAWSQCDFLLAEIPSLSGFRINYPLTKGATINYLLCVASRTWSAADSHYLEKLRTVADGSLYVVLNKITPDNIEEFIGDIPKKRSPFRRFVKNRLFKRYIGFHL